MRSTVLTVLIFVAAAGARTKCCREGEVLSASRNSCIASDKSMHISFDRESSYKGYRQCPCIDITEDLEVVELFCNKSYNVKTDTAGKCCPTMHLYSKIKHGCVPTHNVFPYTEHYRRIGLPKCGINKALVDTSTYSDVDACWDVAYEIRRRIWRTCVDISYCDVSKGGKRCIRKCCPDGHHYKKDRKCAPAFSTGLNLTEMAMVFEAPEGKR